MRFYYRHICWRHIISVLCLLMVVFHASGEDVSRCGSCVPRVVVKTNLAHDALLVPDIGVEVEIGRRFSVSAEGVFACWGTDVSPVCWRVAGDGLRCVGGLEAMSVSVRLRGIIWVYMVMWRSMISVSGERGYSQ